MTGKTFILSIIFGCITLQTLGAAVSVPPWVFKIDKLAEAKKSAEKNKLPLTFVVTDLTLRRDQSELTKKCFNQLKSDATLVVVDTSDNLTLQNVLKQLSPVFNHAHRSKELEFWIPRIIVMTTDMTGVWTTLPKARIGDDGEFAHFKKKLQSIKAGKEKPSYYPEVALRWGKKDRSSSLGSFVSLKSGVLTLSYKGKQYEHDLEDFHAGAKSYAQARARQSLKAEEWSNLKGKIIKGTFVSLSKGKVTLLLENGKKTTFPLKMLSPGSRQRAEKLSENQ